VDDDIPYLLLTPGPLTTSRTVRQAMLRDSCTWDADYNQIVQDIRQRLVRLATPCDGYTSVLMQGSGTFAVEATLGSVIPPDGKLLIVNNGAYGQRMVQIADRLRIERQEIRLPETEPVQQEQVARYLRADRGITHVAVVHCETTTGLLNPVADLGRVAAEFGKVFLVDAMSSFGGIPLTMEELGADFLISSANKCIQGVPGFAFVVAERTALEQSRGWARSLSLDLYDQWREMEEKGGKWRYTSPTHVVRAFAQALDELDKEGGVVARHARYRENHRRLLAGMERLGFWPLLPPRLQSPIITAFYYPKDGRFTFEAFYQGLKSRRFVIYPGKISNAETFRIGTIGHVFPDDIDELVRCVAEVMEELKQTTEAQSIPREESRREI
jgi:2-aminoethylphosphonate-pyruvate transaminase